MKKGIEESTRFLKPYKNFTDWFEKRGCIVNDFKITKKETNKMSFKQYPIKKDDHHFENGLYYYYTGTTKQEATKAVLAQQSVIFAKRQQQYGYCMCIPKETELMRQELEKGTEKSVNILKPNKGFADQPVKKLDILKMIVELNKDGEYKLSFKRSFGKC